MSSTSSKASVQLLIDSLIFHGVKQVVVSPGSRNAPLVIGLAASKKIELISIVDERSAAFFALGLAQQTNTPVPVICTSGSALLNYAPAVAEAYYQKTPLLIVSADRPKEWVDQGDGQTIVQNDVFKNFIHYQTSFPYEPQSEDELWFVKREIETALNFSKKGPAHINIPFKEPLYEQVENQKLTQKNFLIDSVEKSLSSLLSQQLKKIWNTCSKKMILIGQMTQNDNLLRELQVFLDDPETVVLDENLSNIKDAKAIHCIDRTLAGIETEVEVENFVPEILISIGGAIVSKKMKSFLRQNKPQHHWRIGESFETMDTYQSMTVSIPINPTQFFKSFSDGLNWTPNTNFGFQWKQIDKLTEAKHDDFLRSAPYSDLKVAEVVLDCIPDSSKIHLGNSSIVRYAQLFNPVRTIQYYGNRGTSGIDGSMSTAFGAAHGDKNKLHTLILGDLSFFYDSNALWNQLKVPNLRIIVVNNSGGGIFQIIPGPSSSECLDQFFTTKHSFSAEYICKAFDVSYQSVSSIDGLEQSMGDFYAESSNSRPKLMEIFTPYNENDKVLKNYFKYLSQ